MKKEILRSLKKADIVLFLFLILFYLILIFYPYTGKRPYRVVIFHNDHKIIKDITKDEIIKIEDAVIEIKDDGVRMVENDCPGKQCESTGRINEVGEFILCDYDNILIKIEGEKEKYDAITF